ncbi:MAG: type VI secretion system tube protein Hcp [Cellvibrionaceae bacterium]|nr:type VI secretion system tube protein Hcp [Cellvibrionaceae bacterium]
MSIFMLLEGIRGESSDNFHKEWIDVESIEWRVGRQITSRTSTRGDRESSNPEFSELLLFKRIDIATPYIFLESCCGRGKTIIIECTKTGAGNGSDVYMQYRLENAVISRYNMCVKSTRNKRPMEAIKISFKRLEQRYISYGEDNVAGAPIAVGYDAARNMVA